MKCILHIGTEKTGTTSFQRFFAENRELLLERGVWYPECLGRPWHRELSVFAMPVTRRDDAFDTLGITNEQEHNEFKAEKIRRFREEAERMAKKPGVDSCVISSEHFHSRLASVDEVRRVRAFLEPHFSQITVVAHLRPQVDLLISYASTAARGGVIVDRNFFGKGHLLTLYYKYFELLEMWEEVFGIENVEAIAFKSRPDMVSVVADLVGIDVSDLPGRQNANVALDVRTIALLNDIKRTGHPVHEYVHMIDQLPVRDRLKISLDEAREIQSLFSEGNEKLARKYGTLTVDELTPNWDKYPETGNRHLLEMQSCYGDLLVTMMDEIVRLRNKVRTLRDRK